MNEWEITELSYETNCVNCGCLIEKTFKMAWRLYNDGNGDAFCLHCATIDIIDTIECLHEYIREMHTDECR